MVWQNFYNWYIEGLIFVVMLKYCSIRLDSKLLKLLHKRTIKSTFDASASRKQSPEITRRLKKLISKSNISENFEVTFFHLNLIRWRFFTFQSLKLLHKFEFKCQIFSNVKFLFSHFFVVPRNVLWRS